MKLIDKNHLRFVDGYVVDKDNEIINLSGLASEVNEIVEIRQLVNFLVANKAAILGAGDPVVYRPEEEKAPRLTSGIKVETPLLDAEVKAATARAEEWLSVQNQSDIDNHLARYKRLASFFAEDYILTTPLPIPPARFKDDVLEWSEEDVIEIVKSYHDPENVKLRGLVTIDFS